MSGTKLSVIGLTGGIGSGKSTVSGYFAARGYTVIDADKVAREIVEPGSKTLDELVIQFGGGILKADGSLDRKKLAGLVFGDDEKRERLNSIMHGEIFRIMESRIDVLAESGYNGIVLLDIPLLFEVKNELSLRIDETWVVDAAEEVRVRRVMERDGCLREEVLGRMDSQMSGGEKREKAHVIIDNSGEKEELYQQLDKLIEKHEQQ